jgi:hypothetical protein
MVQVMSNRTATSLEFSYRNAEICAVRSFQLQHFSINCVARPPEVHGTSRVYLQFEGGHTAYSEMPTYFQVHSIAFIFVYTTP